MLASLLTFTLLMDNPFKNATWLTVPAPAHVTTAQWIWVQKPGQDVPTATNAPDGTVHLVREWNLASKPTNFKVTFTADNASTLSVNGTVVAKSGEWSNLTEVDIASKLKKGANRLDITATNTKGVPGKNPGGFLLAGEGISSGDGWSSPDGKVVVLGDFGSEPWNLRETDHVPVPEFRHSFSLKKNVTKAVAKVIGLGHYDIFVNGHRQGTGLLNQAWSQYDKRLYWQEFDVTHALKSGENLVGVQMGGSFYRVPQPRPDRYAKGDSSPDFSNGQPYVLAAIIDVTYADGHHESIATDPSWKWKPSPYTLSHVYSGEDYDARLAEHPNEGWQPPVIAKAPQVEFDKVDWPEFRQVQSWKPTKVVSPKPGVWSYVFPQNISGILKFKVKGPRGSTVEFRPSEVITEQGEVQQLNLWGGKASCAYTLRGGPAESYSWRFFYHGFQFVQMTGAVPKGQPNPHNLPVIESIEAVHVRTSNPTVGSFETSDPLYNRIHGLVDWAVQSNMGYVMTDCPHREKLGWLECAHLLFSSFAYRYDAHDWFRKIGRDIRDAQLEDGRITTVAPAYLMLPPDNPYKFTIEWGAAGILMPWQAYQWYGDKTFLSDSYVSMKRFVDWMDRDAPNHISRPGLGDWYDYGHGKGPGPSRFTPTDLTGTAVFAMCVDALVQSAHVLGKSEDEAHYRALWHEIRTAFIAKFYNPTTKTFANTGSVQSGHAMALCANLVPEQDRAAVLNGIISDLEKRGYQQTPGDVGHLFFIRALASAGRSDVLHKVYSRTGLGSYGGILAKGLTTMPETWDAITVGSNSLNHCMLGHIQEWFYGYVLGIRQAPGSVGWSQIIIAPEPGDLKSAKGKTGTPHGEVSVSWKKLARGFSLDVTIPKGSRAEVMLPVKASHVSVNGKSVPVHPQVHGKVGLSLGAGHYVIKA